VKLYWSYKSRIREIAKTQRGVKSVNLEPALDVLFKHVYINAKLMTRSLGVNDSTARRAIQGLGDIGAVVETTGRNRNREYCCVELLKLLKG
jgi:Fic family protein